MRQPLVTVGVPTYNRPDRLQAALESILSQDHTHLEVVVSDNASTMPEVGQVIAQFAAADDRIVAHRQPRNLGALQNFRFTLQEATGELFTWWADDDRRSPDYVAANVRRLMVDDRCVASTSPFRFEGSDVHHCYSLTGARPARYRDFLRHAWRSHALFYSVMRTGPAQALPEASWHDYLGFDWTFVLHLADHGELRCIPEGLVILGTGGESQQLASWRRHIHSWQDQLLPLRTFTLDAARRSTPFDLSDRLAVLVWLLRLNLELNADRLTTPLRTRAPGLHRMLRRLRDRFLADQPPSSA
jgi:glycosyltransferase involved in cell wall biosynthesis